MPLLHAVAILAYSAWDLWCVDAQERVSAHFHAKLHTVYFPVGATCRSFFVFCDDTASSAEVV